MDIRMACVEDLHDIVRIYNQAVETKKSTAETVPVTVAQKEPWFHEHLGGDYPIYVCEIKGAVCGWVSLSPYRPGRQALRYTAEVSYYVDRHHQGMGIGSRLLEHVIAQCPAIPVRTLFAIILEHNEASVGLLKKFGFSQWGFLPRVADFDGEECGHLYYGLRLAEDDNSLPGTYASS